MPNLNPADEKLVEIFINAHDAAMSGAPQLKAEHYANSKLAAEAVATLALIRAVTNAAA
jgi:hypothetical protein